MTVPQIAEPIRSRTRVPRRFSRQRSTVAVGALVVAHGLELTVYRRRPGVEERPLNPVGVLSFARNPQQPEKGPHRRGHVTGLHVAGGSDAGMILFSRSEPHREEIMLLAPLEGFLGRGKIILIPAPRIQ